MKNLGFAGSVAKVAIVGAVADLLENLANLDVPDGIGLIERREGTKQTTVVNNDKQRPDYGIVIRKT
jgi:uncharacterized membrane-anchored protein